MYGMSHATTTTVSSAASVSAVYKPPSGPQPGTRSGTDAVVSRVVSNKQQVRRQLRQLRNLTIENRTPLDRERALVLAAEAAGPATCEDCGCQHVDWSGFVHEAPGTHRPALTSILPVL
jgi:hypothetical protein